MAGPAFMPMFWADYFTATRRLTTEQHGAYLLIIGTMWAEGVHHMPVKDLPHVAHCSPAKWAKIWPVIAPYFTVENGVASHDRVEKELKKALEKSAARSESGKRGGEASALKRHMAEPANGAANGAANAPASVQASSQQLRAQKEESLPSTTESKTPPTPPAGKPPAGAGCGSKRDMPEWMEAYFEKWWSEYPIKKRKLAARPVFRRAWPKIAPPEGREGPDGRFETLMAGTRAYLAQIKARGTPPDKIAHPATWLNGGGWADDYTGTKPKAPRGAF